MPKYWVSGGQQNWKAYSGVSLALPAQGPNATCLRVVTQIGGGGSGDGTQYIDSGSWSPSPEAVAQVILNPPGAGPGIVPQTEIVHQWVVDVRYLWAPYSQGAPTTQAELGQPACWAVDTQNVAVNRGKASPLNGSWQAYFIVPRMIFLDPGAQAVWKQAGTIASWRMLVETP